MKLDLSVADLKLIRNALIEAAVAAHGDEKMFAPFQDEDSQERAAEYRQVRDEYFALHHRLTTAIALEESDAKG